MATHALLLESGTVLFFDVVTDYSVQQQTQTTEHTLETGAVQRPGKTSPALRFKTRLTGSTPKRLSLWSLLVTPA